MYEEVLDIDVETLHQRIRKNVVDDTKANVKEYKERGAFMGKIGAKKFYIIYKPAFIFTINYLTVMNADIEATDDGKTRLRYRFRKFKGAVFLSSLLLILATVFVALALINAEFNGIVYTCIIGFWVLSAVVYMLSMVTSRESRLRLLEFVESLANE
ncbi:MAG: hypothetical protein K5656_03180 [Lachnospiraceae bacterium]|nr:hypothetical protein [Lachnospiraceae bacterium]